jgi:hypothetical protein
VKDIKPAIRSAAKKLFLSFMVMGFGVVPCWDGRVDPKVTAIFKTHCNLLF